MDIHAVKVLPFASKATISSLLSYTIATKSPIGRIAQLLTLLLSQPCCLF